MSQKDYIMHKPKVSALHDLCIIASSKCATLKDEMSARQVLNVLLVVT